MAKGKKYGDEIKERAVALYLSLIHIYIDRCWRRKFNPERNSPKWTGGEITC